MLLTLCKSLENRRELIVHDSGDGLYRVLTKSNVLFEDGKNLVQRMQKIPKLN
jgi:hypothetical protein